MTYKLTGDVPQRFYDDAWDAACDVPPKVKVLSRTYRIEGTPEQWSELLSRADYYSFTAGLDMRDPFMRGLVSSAKATVRAIKRQHPSITA